MASSRVIGRVATASSERTRWTSVDLATAGNLCTTSEISVVSASPIAVGRLSCAPLPFHFFCWFLCSWRFLLRQRVLYLTACFSRCSRAWLMADFMSHNWAIPTRGPLRVQDSGGLLIRQRPERVVFLDQLLAPALED